MATKGNETVMELGAADALIVVDVQNDFLPGGSLATSGGDRIIEPLNVYLARFHALGLPLFATRCWHPDRHCSFKAQGGPWPPHCIAGTGGAGFPPDLRLPVGIQIISKGTQVHKDAYSGFEDTDLDARLKRAGAQRLFIGGLATDVCVLNTVRDAIRLDYDVCLLIDAMRAVNVQPDDGANAEAEMYRLGAVPLDLRAIKT